VVGPGSLLAPRRSNTATDFAVNTLRLYGEPEYVTQARRLIALAVVATALLCLTSRAAKDVGRIALLIGAWTVCAVSGFTHGDAINFNSLVFPAVIVALVGAMDVRSALKSVAGATTFVATMSLTVATFRPDWVYLSVSKSPGVVPELYLAGPFPHPNTLAQALALSIPLSASLFRLRWAVATTGLLLYALVLTGSRTALAAAVLALALALAQRSGSLRRHARRLAAAASCMILVLTPWVVTEAGPTAFNTRGTIWAASVDYVSDDWILGLGPGFYDRIALYNNLLTSGAAHAHNQLLHFLITGGIILVVLAVWIIGTGVRSAAQWRHQDEGVSAALLAFFVALLLVSVLEVPLSLFSLQSLSYVTWIPLLAALTSAHPPAHDGTGAGHYPRRISERAAI
jgi:O-antigen ligase